MNPKRYELGAGCSLDGQCGPYIKCLECNRISYHPKDVAELYCNRCNRFLDEPEQQLEVA